VKLLIRWQKFLMKIIVVLSVRKILLYLTLEYAYKIDINEFIRGFILTTKGDLQSKIEYTFRIYDQNGDQQISGEEIKKMANVI
jgi:Ca2+-binding EF-hand superfamily protein